MNAVRTSGDGKRNVTNTDPGVIAVQLGVVPHEERRAVFPGQFLKQAAIDHISLRQ